MTAASVAHPAPFTPSILDRLTALTTTRLPATARVLDPFAGTGRIHHLPHDTVGVELEPEWAGLHPGTIRGDATALPFPAATFDAVATSPTYGNRMADCHNARDASYRRTYRHLLGRPLTPGSTGGLQWGPAYRALHARAWAEAHRVIRPGGWLWLNCKDHIRGGTVQPVTAWHIETLTGLGFELVRTVEVSVRGARYGANGAARVDHETIAEFGRPA